MIPTAIRMATAVAKLNQTGGAFPWGAFPKNYYARTCTLYLRGNGVEIKLI